MCAGSGHSVKAKPCRAASRALTGCPCFPAMDTCGRRTRKPPAGARSKEVRSSKIQRQQHKKAFFASRGFPGHTDMRRTRCTQGRPACAPQSSPHTCAVTARPAFICPRRHARYADLALRRILPTRLAHGVQFFDAYRLPMCRMVIWSRRYPHQHHAGYSPAPHPIRTRRIPDARIMRPRFCADACSFVLHCLRRPAYVSSIRCAYSLTAGQGPCPFEPRKGKRQEKQ